MGVHGEQSSGFLLRLLLLFIQWNWNKPSLCRFFAVEEIFVKSIYEQHVALQNGIKKLSEKFPEKKIVVLAESLYMGAIPMGQKDETLLPHYIKPSGGTIGLGLLPVSLSAKNLAPHDRNQYLPILPITQTEQEEQEKKKHGNLKVLLQKANKRFAKVMEDLGVKTPFGFFLDEVYNAPNPFHQPNILWIPKPTFNSPAVSQKKVLIHPRLNFRIGGKM